MNGLKLSEEKTGIGKNIAEQFFYRNRAFFCKQETTIDADQSMCSIAESKLITSLK